MSDRNSTWKTWAVAVALALIFGLLEAAQLRLGSGVLGRPMPLSTAITRVLPSWLVFACVMPLAVMIGRRFRVWRFVLRPTIPAVAAMGTCFALLVLGVRVLVPTAGAGPGARLPTPLQVFQTYFVLDVLTYTALVGTFYAFHYHREARGRELTALRLQASLADARLKGLEAQVDPAFLFRTLGTIADLAAKGDQKAVIDTLDRLSELLRAALTDQKPEEIPLSSEVGLLQHHLASIESTDMQRMAIAYEIAPDVHDALVPRAMLTSLLSAAVSARKPESRPIRVRAMKADDAVLQLDLSGFEPCDEVRNRLQQLYGRAQRISVSADGERNPAVVVSIPFRRALAGEDAVLLTR